MRRFLLPLAIVFGLTSGTAAAQALLRPNVVVDGEVVKLGDLFDNIGNKADVAVARAPLPGQRTVVDADWLQHMANMNGVDWRPQDPFQQAVIARNSVTISHEQIEAELLKALSAQGSLPENPVVDLAARQPQLIIPVGVGSDVGVRELSYDPRYKRFSAIVEAPANAANAMRIRVSGRVLASFDVPVLVRGLSHDEVIAARDLTWSRVREDMVRRDIVTDVDHIIGMAPRQTMRPGQMISASDLKRPLAVTRGALVTMVLNIAGMSLTTQGRAIEQGSVGDVIRVSNTRSNLTVEGKVEGPNLISVRPNGTTAMAN